MKKTIISLAALLLSTLTFSAGAQSKYITPPQEITELMLAKPVPTAVFNNQNTLAVIQERDSPYIPLSRIVEMKEYRVGGARIDARNFSSSRYKEVINRIKLLNVATGSQTAIAGVPSNLGLFDIKWSPAGDFFCFLNRTPNEIELYKVDVTAAEPKAEKINVNKVNATFGTTYAILYNGSVIYRSVPADLGAFPKAGLPKGPIIQKTNGKKDSYRTYEDLITSAYDEDVFTYLCTSLLSIWNAGETKTIGTKQIFRSFTPSPDGSHLLVTTEHKPYSYVKGHSSFPSRYVIWNIEGKEVKVIRDLPKDNADKDASAKKDDKVKKPQAPSRSSYGWRDDEGATLCWIETLPRENSKDTTKKDEERKYYTSVWQCTAPFNLDKDKKLVHRSEYALSEVTWGNDHFALYTESSGKQKMRRLMAFDPSDTAKAPQVIYSEDTSRDTIGNKPVLGDPLRVRNQYGRSVVYADPKGKVLYLTGKSRRDEAGDKMSYIDKFTFKNGKMENIWMCSAPYNESLVGIRSIDNGKLNFISLRQSPKEVPNYYAVEINAKGKVKHEAVTNFENPLPQLQDIQDTFITYKRADGVILTARLFLPAGYDKERDGKLPVFMWTYPYEYRCVAEAQKYRQDRYTFPVPSRTVHIMWATKGYAVVQGFSMPIISKTTKSEPNDDFINQLVMNAEAVINYLDEQGIGDRNRVAVGGHSYGSFMTANLMTHTKHFKAGLAESGAFNRTLTPFGFQNEGRSYWKAKKVYDEMSPFNYADKLSGHILLVHGTMDENSGTFPIQSERLFQAFAGHGGDADYVQLPYEQHGYIYTENMLHLFGSTFDMLEKYVKNAKPAAKETDKTADKKSE